MSNTGSAVSTAENGLSINSPSPGDYRAVLGQDIGEAGDPAVLLSNREIPMDAFTLALLPQVGVVNRSITIDNTGIAMAGNAGVDPNGIAARLAFTNTGNTNNTVIDQVAGGGRLRMRVGAVDSSSVLFNAGGVIVYTGITTPGTAAEGDVTLYGSAAFRSLNIGLTVNTVFSGQGNYTYWNNNPPAVLTVTMGNPPVGAKFTVLVVSDDAGMIITGPADNFFIGIFETGVGGSLISETAGSAITFEKVRSSGGNDIWHCISSTGEWVLI